MIAMDSARRSQPETGNATRAGTPFATLCYESRAKARPSEDDLTELVDDARERNRQFGVTGMLVHQGDRFFQWLEGPGAALDGLWSSIRRDDRHGDIQLLGEGVTPIRLFSDWDLRFLHRGDDDPPAVDGAAAPTSVESDPVDASGVARLAELALAGDDPGLETLRTQLQSPLVYWPGTASCSGALCHCGFCSDVRAA